MLLKNFDVYARFLDYDTATGRGVEVDRTVVPESDREGENGVYVNRGDGVVGVFRTKGGPVLFIDGERIPLGEADRAEVRKGEGDYEFVLFTGNQPRLFLRYKPPAMHYDNWSDDEDIMDMFQWLANRLSPEFCRSFRVRGET